MPTGSTKPSRAEILASRGLYPVAVPFGWHLIGEDGEPAAIPRVDDGAFHKLLAQGALLAMEGGDSATRNDDAAPVFAFRAGHG